MVTQALCSVIFAAASTQRLTMENEAVLSRRQFRKNATTDTKARIAMPVNRQIDTPLQIWNNREL